MLLFRSLIPLPAEVQHLDTFRSLKPHILQITQHVVQKDDDPQVKAQAMWG